MTLLAHPVQAVAWVVALSWVYKVVEAAIGLPAIADLLEEQHDKAPAGMPSLTVIVPGRNEAGGIGACLGSLLTQDYAAMEILTVNDRSTDATGAVMEALASQHPDRLRVLHVTELPPDWLGKTHAMALAASRSETEWLLFTDADVVFRADSLRRSLAYAVASGADHLVTAPTPIIARWDEGMLLGFFQIFGLWAARPWKIADPRARDAIGVGAFNLVRRSAYEQIGGFASLRMEIVEDLGLGRRIKRAGLPQRLAFGRGLVRVHWAPGAFGLVEVMTKNLFAACGFYVSLALLACGWLTVFCIAPVFELFQRETRIPAAISLAAIAGAYWLYRRASGIPARQAALSPVAASLFVYTMLRSMVTTLLQGGVVWRGTLYPLKTLRKYAAPLLKNGA